MAGVVRDTRNLAFSSSVSLFSMVVSCLLWSLQSAFVVVAAHSEMGYPFDAEEVEEVARVAVASELAP